VAKRGASEQFLAVAVGSIIRQLLALMLSSG